MQESAFLINGLTMEVVDEEDDKRNIYVYENGLASFIEYINDGKELRPNEIIQIQIGLF